VSDAGLLRLAVAAGEARTPVFDGLERAAELGLDAADRVRAAELVSILAALRRARGRVSLGDLVRETVERFDLDLALAARGSEGERALQALSRLAWVADEHEAGGGDAVDLGSHLEFREERARRERPSSGMESADSVRVMSIHAAKGLEFPAVVVAGLGREVRLESRRPVLVEKGPDGPRVGFKLPGARGEGRPEAIATPVWEALRRARHAREIDEAKRVLYVACTRAREALLLVGSGKLQGTKEAPLEWLGSALGLHGTPGGWPREAMGARVSLLSGEAATPVAPRSTTDGPLTGRPRSCRVAVAETAAPAPGTVSYSSLAEWRDCSYRHRTLRTAGLGHMPRSDDGPTAFGSAVHAILRVVGGREPDHGVMRAVAGANGLAGEDAERAIRAATELLGSPGASRARTMSRVRREAPFAVDIEGTLLVGSLDVYAREGERALIVDYKTGRAPADARAEHRLQAECYALAALADGARQVEVVFTHAQGDDTVFGFSTGDEGALMAGVAELIAETVSGPALPLTGYSERLCPECPAYGATCPVSGPPAR
jgi:ATP-dependent exoDNAse (exonuclease V) beta subunit